VRSGTGKALPPIPREWAQVDPAKKRERKPVSSATTKEEIQPSRPFMKEVKAAAGAGRKEVVQRWGRRYNAASSMDKTMRACQVNHPVQVCNQRVAGTCGKRQLAREQEWWGGGCAAVTAACATEGVVESGGLYGATWREATGRRQLCRGWQPTLSPAMICRSPPVEATCAE